MPRITINRCLQTQDFPMAPSSRLCDIVSEPQREAPAFAAHPISPIADRVILLPADAVASALGIFRPRHAVATSVQQSPPDGLQRDRRHGNTTPSLSVGFAHHTATQLSLESARHRGLPRIVPNSYITFYCYIVNCPLTPHAGKAEEIPSPLYVTPEI